MRTSIYGIDPSHSSGYPKRTLSDPLSQRQGRQDGRLPSTRLVERAVDARLGAALQEAEARLLAQFGQITVEDLAQDYEKGLASLPQNSGDADSVLPGFGAGK